MQPVKGFSSTRMLYGVQVIIKLNRMADRVFAAFVSCFFSCDFFFFFIWRGTGNGFTMGFGMILAFSGMRMSCACDGRRVMGRLYSESLEGSGRRDGCGNGSGTSSWIILIDGARSSPCACPFCAPPSDGSRMRIV